MHKEEVGESSPPSKIPRFNEDEDLSLSKPGSSKDEDEDLSLSKTGSLKDEDEDEDEDLEYEYEYMEDEDDDEDWKPKSPQFEEEEEEDLEEKKDLEDEDEDLEDEDNAFRVADMTLSKPGPLADEHAPQLLDSVPKLPKDTWAQWKSQAVYFVGQFRGPPSSPRNFGGVSMWRVDQTRPDNVHVIH